MLVFIYGFVTYGTKYSCISHTYYPCYVPNGTNKLNRNSFYLYFES